MSNVRPFPPRKNGEKTAEPDPLAFYRHAPRYPATQSVGGAVVGQVIVHPSSPDQSRNAAPRRDKGEDQPS